MKQLVRKKKTSIEKNQMFLELLEKNVEFTFALKLI